ENILGVTVEALLLAAGAVRTGRREADRARRAAVLRVRSTGAAHGDDDVRAQETRGALRHRAGRALGYDRAFRNLEQAVLDVARVRDDATPDPVGPALRGTQAGRERARGERLRAAEGQLLVGSELSQLLDQLVGGVRPLHHVVIGHACLLPEHRVAPSG